MAGNHTQALLGILQDYAPTGTEQEECAAAVRQAEADGVHGRELDRLMAGWLLNGLAYGNWPWVRHGKGTVTQGQGGRKGTPAGQGSGRRQQGRGKPRGGNPAQDRRQP